MEHINEINKIIAIRLIFFLIPGSIVRIINDDNKTTPIKPMNTPLHQRTPTHSPKKKGDKIGARNNKCAKKAATKKTAAKKAAPKKTTAKKDK